jgi:hypothetical protein
VKTLEGAMDRFVARANVQHFRDLVAKEANLPERERLTKMLSEEEAKLAEAERLHDEVHKDN